LLVQASSQSEGPTCFLRITLVFTALIPASILLNDNRPCLRVDVAAVGERSGGIELILDVQKKKL
jgi:hypothetical protein